MKQNSKNELIKKCIIYQGFIAATAVGVSFSFLEEGERLAHTGITHSAGATVDLRHAVGVLADQLALGLGAGRFVTLPVAFGLFADGLALRLRSLAVSYAVRLLAHGNALRAVE